MGAFEILLQEKRGAGEEYLTKVNNLLLHWEGLNKITSRLHVTNIHRKYLDFGFFEGLQLTG